MGTLYITEFQSAVSPIGSTMAPVLPQVALAQQNLGISGTSAPSAAFGSKTYAVELFTDTACTFLFAYSGTPVAVVSGGNRMAANERRVYAVAPGMLVAVIA